MFQLRYTGRFDKALSRLPRKARRRVLERIEELCRDPYLGKPLRGVLVNVAGSRQTPRSLRVGDYRVIYLVDPFSRTVLLLTVRHRRHVYKEF